MFRGFTAIVLIFILTACNPGEASTSHKKSELTILAAASLTEAFDQLKFNFEQLNSQTAITISYAGSQQLAQQIIQGAPADVYASANLDQMNNVIQAGMIASTTSQVFAQNQLVIVMPENGPRPLVNLRDLAKPGLKIILAAEEVPVGAYTLEFLDKAASDPAYGSDFKNSVLRNVVSYEANVKAVVNKITLGEADAGIVYASDVNQANQEQLTILDIPNELNALGNYYIAPLIESTNGQQAANFISFLLSPEGQKILTENGLLPVNSDLTP